MIFQRSMLDWRRGGVNLPWVYVHCAIYETYLVSLFSRDLCLLGGVALGSICHGYMCIMLYMKLICCNGFSEIYAHLEEGWGQSAMGICALCYIWSLFGVMVFQRSMLDCRSGVRVNLPWVYVHFAIYIWNLFGVMVFQRSMLDCRRGVQICQ